MYNLDQLLLKARQIASEAHLGVKRHISNEDYINHPRRIAEAAEPYGIIMQMAAWLHDVVEDNPAWTMDRLRAEGFPESVLTLVDAVTRRKADGESYSDFIQRIRGHSKDAATLKKLDLQDNLRDLPMGNSLRHKYTNALDTLNS